MDRRGDEYSYRDAGYNGFLRRTFFSNPDTNNLSNLPRGGNMINFDRQQTSGSLGDMIKVGNVTIDGRNGRISVFDDSGNEVVRIGELDG